MRMLAEIARTPRMRHWLVVSIALLLLDVWLVSIAQPAQPSPLHLILHKADMVTWGAWLGWAIDRAIDPDGEPDELRRGLVMAAAILGFALGL